MVEINEITFRKIEASYFKCGFCGAMNNLESLSEKAKCFECGKSFKLVNGLWLIDEDCIQM